MIDFLASIPIGIWGVIIGASASIVTQYFIYRYRLFTSAKRFRRDMANLMRHIEASMNSLDLSVDRPKYLLAARIRFCKFLDGVSSLDDLDWLTRRRDSNRILPTLLAIRNSDIFLEEVALRIEDMNDEELAEALNDAKLNLEFLRKTVERLGYSTVADDLVYTKHFARDVLADFDRQPDGSAAKSDQHP